MKLTLKPLQTFRNKGNDNNIMSRKFNWDPKIRVLLFSGKPIKALY